MQRDRAAPLPFSVVVVCLFCLSSGTVLRGRKWRPPSEEDVQPPPDALAKRKAAQCVVGQENGVDKWQVHVHHKCPERTESGPSPEQQAVLSAARGRLPDFDRSLLNRVGHIIAHAGHGPESKYGPAFGQLTLLSGLDPKEVFALRETWTDEDTEILRGLDNHSGGFAQGNLTTASFAARLPSRDDFNSLLAKSKTAIVGSGPSLEGGQHGADIDSHPAVARFNQLVGGRLVANDTGSRTTIHVMNHEAPPDMDASVEAHIDLEWAHPWSSYCSRMHTGGKFSKVTGKLFIIRPSVFCMLGDGPEEFTRGFLFYWLVGRHMQQVDLYGFKGKGHYRSLQNVSDDDIGEKFLGLEHLVYQQLSEMRADMKYI